MLLSPISGVAMRLGAQDCPILPARPARSRLLEDFLQPVAGCSFFLLRICRSYLTAFVLRSGLPGLDLPQAGFDQPFVVLTGEIPLHDPPRRHPRVLSVLVA